MFEVSTLEFCLVLTSVLYVVNIISIPLFMISA
jgi:hypothetical protein